MDAGVTKQRLGNMLSYDWLKILLSIAAAVLVLTLVFTMAATRPTKAQTFTVYAYNGVSAGEDFNALENDLTGGTFSYDILKTGTESFNQKASYSASVFTARRSALEGSVMFVSHYAPLDENGNKTASQLDNLTTMGLVTDRDGEHEGMLRDPARFMEDCASYLKGFFGEDLSGEPDMERVRACFMERNGKDKRFRSDEKKEEGIALERSRILKLRDDYLAVSKEFEEGGLFSYTSSTAASGNSYCVGINVGKLNRITQLFYYTKEGSTQREREELNLIIFDNGERDGMSDLKYEAISFLKYLLVKYA